MIITQLKGGLGNQLFQYALGRRLAIENDCALKLDTSWFEKRKGNCTYRIFQLNHFTIQAEEATEADVASLVARKKLRSRGSRMCAKILRGKNRPYILERWSGSFDAAVAALRGPVYLEGYWQSYRYFDTIKKALIDDLRLAEALSPAYVETLERMRQTDSVGVHIRRGDYVSNPVYQKKFGTVTLDYYRRSIAYMAEKIARPHFFVFTDDYAWVKQNVLFDFPVTWMEQETKEKDCADLWMMAQCRHHIIANSSYSWWGAWLSPHTDAITVNPRFWNYREKRYNSDRSPRDWVVI